MLASPRCVLGPALGAMLLALSCGGEAGEQRSFVSNKIEAVPTNVSGPGTMSGNY